MAQLRPSDGKYRGELNRREADPSLRTARGSPAPELAGSVAYYWLVRWDLRQIEPYEQHVLTEPRQHIVFELDRQTGAVTSRMVGLCRGRFSRRIEGQREIIGVAFHPGGFQPWVGFPMARLTDLMVPLPWEVDRYVMEPDEDRERLARIEEILHTRRPPPDDSALQVREMVETIASEPGLTRVEALTERYELAPRALQRLFQTYVGAGAKWVIRRYRLIEAARKIELGEGASLGELAFGLGYFDQSHFINDFKAIVGHTPSEHARRVAGSPAKALEQPIVRG